MKIQANATESLSIIKNSPRIQEIPSSGISIIMLRTEAESTAVVDCPNSAEGSYLCIAIYTNVV